MSKSVISHVEVISDIGKAIDLKDKAVEEALIVLGEIFEGDAKDELSRPKMHADGSVRPNVDTGRLRNSITYATNTAHSQGTPPADPSDYMLLESVPKGTVVVGTNVEYAAFVEMGTSRSSPYPYLKPSIENNKPTIKKVLEDYLKS